MFQPSSAFFADRFKEVLLLYVLFYIYVSLLSLLCYLVCFCWERADVLALLCVDFMCFATFPIGVPDNVWYLIVPNPDLCLPLFFESVTVKHK